MKIDRYNLARETRFAKSLYGDLSKSALRALRELIQRHQISVTNGDVKFLDGGWYVTHSGLLRLAERRRCAGIHCRPVLESSDPRTSRWVFRAAVFKSRGCRGFFGYLDTGALSNPVVRATGFHKPLVGASTPGPPLVALH